MDAGRNSQPSSMKNRTSVERKSERELVVSRIINAPPRIVFEAWTKAELFQRWWVPKSLGLTLLSCELDVRVGGVYRLVFRHPAAPGAYGTSMQIPRSSTAFAPRLDQRKSGRQRAGHHGHVRGKSRQDAARHARPLSFKGGART